MRPLPAAAAGLAPGGRAGARLTSRLACPVSRSTLIRAAPDPDRSTPLVLGVDDSALRTGHVYGTILVDIETRRPVGMLPGRSAESFRTWLDTHPGAKIICRDRGGCYAEGAAEARRWPPRWRPVPSVAQPGRSGRAGYHPPPLLPARTGTAT